MDDLPKDPKTAELPVPTILRGDEVIDPQGGLQ
jgi:hypothetical protein